MVMVMVVSVIEITAIVPPVMVVRPKSLMVRIIKQDAIVRKCGTPVSDTPWMIYSGLDWSGSPGQESHDRLLVIAVVHFEEEDLPRRDHALDEARKALRLPAAYVFKHLKASEAVHKHVFAALAQVAFLAHVRVVDKSAWTDDYVRRSSGPDRIAMASSA